MTTTTIYDNGSSTVLQVSGGESGNRLTILQSPCFGRELVFSVSTDEAVSSVVVGDAEDLRRIRDYLTGSVAWMEG